MAIGIYKPMGIHLWKGTKNMTGLTDELLFYGGLMLVGGSLVTGIICFCISQMYKIRLIARLDMEYGKQKKK